MFSIDSTFDHYSKINSYRLQTINQIPTIVDTALAPIENLQAQLNVVNFQPNIKKLYASVQQYRPSFCLFIKHFFTGQWFTIRRLRKTLPTTLARVNACVDKIFHTHGSKQQIEKKLDAERAKKMQALGSKIYRKVSLIQTALQNDLLQSHATNSTARKAHQWFTKTLAKLEQGEDAPLPLWFHATSPSSSQTIKNALSILESGFIKQNRAWLGVGVFMSTNSEHDIYGDFVFALDERPLEASNGQFYGGRIDSKLIN